MGLFSIPRSVSAGVGSLVAKAFLVTATCSSIAAGEKQIEEGRTLFLHKWEAHDPLCPEGDGLGPMFNAVSCVACHSLGEVGGAGSTEHNVDLLSATSPDSAGSSPEQVHPGLSSGGSSVLLHRFHTNDKYERWRLSLLGFKIPEEQGKTRAAITRRAIRQRQARRPPVAELRRQHGVDLRLSQRNTTALFGAGVIDSIPEEAVVELAKLQPQRYPGINGRVPRTGDGRMGRFGWRGHVATLRDFVLTACAMEVGLQNADHPQAPDPLDDKYSLKGNDLSAAQCDALVDFVASLPAPREIPPENQRQANLIQNGEKLFETIGCAACHVRNVGNARGIFSDLLLHDMGPGLDDPLAARPEQGKVGTISGGYGGLVDFFADIATPVRREWRTPPLWGVRDSAPYLHDGRAATLEEAIAAHGGEAESAAKRFQQLGGPGRSNLLLFLRTLAAPRS